MTMRDSLKDPTIFGAVLIGVISIVIGIIWLLDYQSKSATKPTTDSAPTSRRFMVKDYSPTLRLVEIDRDTWTGEPISPIPDYPGWHIQAVSHPAGWLFIWYVKDGH